LVELAPKDGQLALLLLPIVLILYGLLPLSCTGAALVAVISLRNRLLVLVLAASLVAICSALAWYGLAERAASIG
jgi:hypothetical protein